MKRWWLPWMMLAIIDGGLLVAALVFVTALVINFG